jgi:polyvinyl alcohol dehydrogenase (cytochrome)
MRWRVHLPPLIAVALAAQAVLAASAGAAAWTTYRHDATRSGSDPDSTSPLTPSQAWQTPQLDGQVYAQPLAYGSNVYVATENDSVYALDAATGAAVWSVHLATPEPSSAAPCGDITPSIGITSTPVIDPSTGRIYLVGAVSDSGAVRHELFALDVNSGQPIAGFPIVVDPPFPSGGSPVNQLQRPGLALTGGRILIGYGGNAGDCATYWGWLVSTATDGTGLTWFQVDASHHAGAIWASGNAPPIDAAGNVFVATGNGIGNSTSDPQFGDSVVKLNAFAAPLDSWTPPNWQSLDAVDADLGSSMPTLLPGGFLFQSGKDGNGYVLNGAGLGGVTSPAATVSLCSGGSFGGSVYDSASSTLYATCGSRVRAVSVGPGSPPSVTTKPGFLAPADTGEPPMIAGGLVWVTNYETGTLSGLDPNSGALSSRFSIPENGSEVNHFASPSAGGGLLFVGSGNQVTAFRIAQPPPPGSTTGTTVTTAGAGAASSGPRISGATLSPRRFRATRATTLRLTVSEAATLTVAATQLHNGRLVRRRCATRAKRGKRCQVRVTFVQLHPKARAGRNALKLRFRRLAPGHYTAFIYATDSSRRRSGNVAIRFTILPPPSSSSRKSSRRGAGASLTAMATGVALGASRSPG